VLSLERACSPRRAVARGGIHLFFRLKSDAVGPRLRASVCPRVVNRARRFIPRALLSAALLAALHLSARAAVSEEAEPGYHSETWTTERGLPGDTVRAVTQTRDGYLWVAMQAGLARFDGVRFHVYSKQTEPAFRSDECNVLLEGRFE
jgi:hypothetical protein